MPSSVAGGHRKTGATLLLEGLLNVGWHIVTTIQDVRTGITQCWINLAVRLGAKGFLSSIYWLSA
jgi:hypothetical protein